MKKLLFFFIFFLTNFANADFSPANWGFQESNFKINVLKKAPHEALILPVQKEDGTFWTAKEVTRIKANGKKVIAAFPIGRVSFGKFGYDIAQGNECDETGYERFWNTRTQNFDVREKCHTNSLFGTEIEKNRGTFAVQYWTPEWREKIIHPILEKIFSAGFDGVFFERTSDFELWTNNRKSTYFAHEMAKLIIGMANTLHAQKGGNFVVIAGEASRILPLLKTKTRTRFVTAIDAIAETSLFFDTTRSSRLARFLPLRKYFVPTRKPIFLLEFSDKKNVLKLKKWKKAFEKVGLPTVLFRAENNGEMNELPAPF